VCDKSFTRSDILKRHQQGHRNKTHGQPAQQSTNKRLRVSENPSSDSPSVATSAGTDHGIAPSANGSLSVGPNFVWGSWNAGAKVSQGHPNADGFDDAFSWASFLAEQPFPGPLDIWDDFQLTSPLEDVGEEGDAARVTGNPIPEDALPSAAPSPPNETSYEDRTPFAWDPSSKRISEVKAVILDPDDPLLLNIDPKFSLHVTTYEALRSVLAQDVVIQGRVVAKSIQSFPSLTVTNAFISRFSVAFLPQAPVIHVHTFCINDNCPTYLLAIMISIGATYCKRKHARRFAIVLQELARCHLSVAVAANDALLKDPLTIYSAALICYSGLWCGNKRAFELAEALRGSVTAWVRRLPTNIHRGTGPLELGNDAADTWRQWIRQESLRRLKWLVYALDCQYACLMNATPSMTIAEVLDWDCPCDDDYWTAPSANRLKLLLGGAIVPPSKAFAAAVGPFLHTSIAFEPLRSLNPWSSFLVLLYISMMVLRHAEQRHLIFKLSHVACDESLDRQVDLFSDEAKAVEMKQLRGEPELTN